MRVLLIGGSGEFGLPTGKALAALEEVEQVIIGARSLERAQEAASQIGGKGRAIQLDATDEAELTKAIADCDFVLNMSSYDTEVTAVRAAIKAGINYCDILSATTAHEQLNTAAEKAGVTAITGIGLGAGLINILCVHLGSMLDEVKEIQALTTIPWIVSLRLQEQLEFGKSPDELYAELLTKRTPYGNYSRHLEGREVDAIEYALSLPWQKPDNTRALGFVDGQWQDVDPIVSYESVPALEERTGRPISVTDNVHYFPRHKWMPDATRANFLGTGFPIKLNEHIATQADRISAQELSTDDAVSEVRSNLEANPITWLSPLSKCEIGAKVLGYKDGRAAASTGIMSGVITEANWYLLTGGPLIAAARRIWRGEIEQKGVLLPEALLDFEDFESEVMALIPEVPSHGRLFKVSLDYLD